MATELSSELQAPHPTAPFEIRRHGTMVAEQGSVENVTSLIYNTAVCLQGTRDDLPEFGVPDETFEVFPRDLEPISEALKRWVPEADLEIEEHLQAVAEAEVQILVSIQQ